MRMALKWSTLPKEHIAKKKKKNSSSWTFYPTDTKKITLKGITEEKGGKSLVWDATFCSISSRNVHLTHSNGGKMHSAQAYGRMSQVFRGSRTQHTHAKVKARRL